MSKSKQAHPYHLVEPSPCPSRRYIRFSNSGRRNYVYTRLILARVFGLGGFLVIATMFGWWRDIIREAQHEGALTQLCNRLRYGALFIASEVMFCSLFWAFLMRVYLMKLFSIAENPYGGGPSRSWGTSIICFIKYSHTSYIWNNLYWLTTH